MSYRFAYVFVLHLGKPISLLEGTETGFNVVGPEILEVDFLNEAYRKEKLSIKVIAMLEVRWIGSAQDNSLLLKNGDVKK